MLKNILIDLIGDYTPVVVDDLALHGAAGVDYAFVGCLLLVLITVYCIWRLIGGWFR